MFPTLSSNSSRSNSSSSRSSSTSSSPGIPPEQKTAEARIVAWIKAGWLDETLDLSGLGLTALRHLPNNLQRLDASNNCIAELHEDLPPWLIELDLSGNRFEDVPMRLRKLNPECKVRFGRNPSPDLIASMFTTDSQGVSTLLPEVVQKNRTRDAVLNVALPRRFQNDSYRLILFCAIRNGRIDKLQELMSHPEVDLNHCEDGVSPLMHAILFQEIEIAKLLCLQARVNPNLGMQTGDTPLHAVTRARIVSMTLVDALLNHPNIDPNLPDILAAQAGGTGVSLLHRACRTKNEALLVRLLAHPKTDPNASKCKPTNGGLYSPLAFAIENAPQLALKLIEHPRLDPDADNQILSGRRISCLNLASKGDPDLVLALIEKGARIDQDTDRGTQRKLALIVGKACVHTLCAPDEHLYSATSGQGSKAQRERGLSSQDLQVYTALKQDADVLLTKIFQPPFVNLGFRLAAMTWASEQTSSSSSLYSESGAETRLNDMPLLDKVIRLQGLSQEQRLAIIAEAVQWLEVLCSQGQNRREAPQERLLIAPRESLAPVTRDILQAWGLTSSSSPPPKS